MTTATWPIQVLTAELTRLNNSPLEPDREQKAAETEEAINFLTDMQETEGGGGPGSEDNPLEP